MASVQNLMSVGVPAAMAKMICTGPIVSITPAGVDQASAAPLTGSSNILVPSSGSGVGLPLSMGQGIITVYNNANSGINVYPAQNEQINLQGPAVPFSVPATRGVIFIPVDQGWICIVSQF